MRESLLMTEKYVIFCAICCNKQFSNLYDGTLDAIRVFCRKLGWYLALKVSYLVSYFRDRNSLYYRGGARNFPTGGLTRPTRGLKYGFQGIVNAKNLRQNSFSPSYGGLPCSNRGL